MNNISMINNNKIKKPPPGVTLTEQRSQFFEYSD